MPSLLESKRTAHNVDIPVLGFGTVDLKGDAGRSILGAAIECGYRHIDTASKYGTEPEVGDAVRASDAPREAFFIATKVPPDMLRHDDVLRSAEDSLRRLDLSYIDLLLVHWPKRGVPIAETMSAFAALKQRGIIRNIGVANFPIALLDEAIHACPEPIITNQVEYHPYLDQRKLLEACRSRGVLMTAFSPIGRGAVLQDPLIQAIALRHQRTPAQVTLRWVIQQEGVITIPRTSSAARLAENAAIFDFELTDEEMAGIGNLHRPDGRRAAPEDGPDWD
ncbi:MAG TPA: aldo/keto reductase [Caulobacteraceae bacterium]|jgi:diketogulonate reductase-like aldo/keto reductase|nr:aldo/keto reductase [Caulobacteraceae bacterium]